MITDKKENDNITNTQVGVNHINITEIKNVPVLFGEKDILKTIQLLPGIKGAGEGNSILCAGRWCRPKFGVA